MYWCLGNFRWKTDNHSTLVELCADRKSDVSTIKSTSSSFAILVFIEPGETQNVLMFLSFISANNDLDNPNNACFDEQ